MIKGKGLMVACTIVLASALAMPAQAAPVYGTSATLTGSTTLSGFGDWTNVSVSWNHVQNGNVWDYNYTFTENGSNLSHVVLEFTAGCAQDPLCITNANHNPDGPKTWGALSPPNFEMPVSIYGVKFDGFTSDATSTFSFTSDRAPVWGDFYARDGGNAYAFNAGLQNHQSSLVGDFVARPNGPPGDNGVPEPATMAMFGAGVLALAAYKRRALTL